MFNPYRTSWYAAVGLGSIFAALYLTSGKGQAAPDGDALVLVELFTSEGCSSCPPADTLLAELYAKQPRGVTLLPLSFHVDYWDHLGWKDPFSDAVYTQRQQAYAVTMKSSNVYTPQMVVNGVKGFVGSNRGEALRAIDDAAKQKCPVLKLEVSTESKSTLNVRVGDLPPDAKDYFIWVAVAEDELVSKVTRGENRGRDLTHQAVVRTMLTAPHTSGKQDVVSLAVPWDATWKRDHCRLVAVAQHAGSGAILALGQLSLGSSE